MTFQHHSLDTALTGSIKTALTSTDWFLSSRTLFWFHFINKSNFADNTHCTAILLNSLFWEEIIAVLEDGIILVLNWNE